MTSFFFFNDTATTEIYTLSLHDALPILKSRRTLTRCWRPKSSACLLSSTSEAGTKWFQVKILSSRSEEHTSELQSRQYLVCRLLLEKKNKIQIQISYPIVSISLFLIHLN